MAAAPSYLWLALTVLAIAAIASTAARLPAAVYPDGPPAAHTGGFGEPSCAACHAGNPVDDPDGSLTVEGIPDRYRPGESYSLSITLARPGMETAGFQLSARFAGGEQEGRQAGTLRSAAADGQASGLVQVIEDQDAGIQYAQQTLAGAEQVEDARARWTVEWIAPGDPGTPDAPDAATYRAPADHPVVFHIAANAGNGDASEFGDFVLLRSVKTTRAK